MSCFVGVVIDRVPAGYRFQCAGRVREMCKFSKPNRLDRRSEAIGSHVAGADLSFLRHDFSNGRSTKPPLALPHPAAKERLQLVRTGRPKGNRLANFAHGNFFTAADDRFRVERCEEAWPGGVKGIQECPSSEKASGLLVQGFEPSRNCCNAHKPQVTKCRERSYASAYLCGLSTCDAAPVAGDIDALSAAPTFIVRDGLEGALFVIPSQLTACRIGEVCRWDHALV